MVVAILGAYIIFDLTSVADSQKLFNERLQEDHFVKAELLEHKALIIIDRFHCIANDVFISKTWTCSTFTRGISCMHVLEFPAYYITTCNHTILSINLFFSNSDNSYGCRFTDNMH